jgi:TRAP-type C4-dicarboxylate transport system permease small subunit
MPKRILLVICFIFLALLFAAETKEQCSICTKTAQQLGEKPAKALNAGIIYLAAMPFLIFSYIGYRWWKTNRDV